MSENARLGPTYAAIYNGRPLIITTYPVRVWFSRAYDQAQQALALASAGSVAAPTPQPVERPPSNRVFVVHGHDHGLKEAVARLVESLGYQAIILHERADRGQTIIEKFEREAPDAAFAVILLTPDDEGRSRSIGQEDKAADLAHRARQNVVWEYGYFVALLRRANVRALVMSDDEVESPSDFDGLLYVPVRTIEDTAWRMKLTQEMKAAGLDIDLNEVP
jgi:predicted nucleotide-binding protein